MNEHEQIIDLSNRDAKRQLMQAIGAKLGLWRLSMREHKPRRSLKSNAYYWSAVVPTFQAFMREHGQFFDKDQVHEFFLQTHAALNVVDPLTGEVLSVIGKRSSQMDQDEFSAFVNAAVGWMSDRFGIIVPEPELAGTR